MYCYLGSVMLINRYDKDVELNNAKICSLFMVEEIINLDNLSIEGREYWMEVKQELLNFI
jgi:hypothetical protein